MDFLNRTSQFSPRLAEYLQAIAEKPLEFEGTDPSQHSGHNHEHLWLLESEADDKPQIDLAYRCAAVNYIFDNWKARLKGYKPYQEQGFRLYLYEDLAPTVSVVAETETGFPYIDNPVFVPTIEEIMRLYVGRSWQAQFILQEKISPKQLLTVLEKNAGSIGHTATALGMSRAALRKKIENWGFDREVNRLRKKNGRRPAKFYTSENTVLSYKIFELKLPPRFP